MANNEQIVIVPRWYSWPLPARVAYRSVDAILTVLGLVWILRHIGWL